MWLVWASCRVDLEDVERQAVNRMEADAAQGTDFHTVPKGVLQSVLAEDSLNPLQIGLPEGVISKGFTNQRF